MAIEIERKFLLTDEDWRTQIRHSQRMRQAYLAGPMAGVEGAPKCSVRVRVAGEQAFINLKSVQLGIERAEYEYAIPVHDAEEMIANLAGDCLQKIRHEVSYEGHVFEIDEFLGQNAGLIVAELELPHRDTIFPRPAWLGVEVSTLARYYNINLISHPYSRWSASERKADDAC